VWALLPHCIPWQQLSAFCTFLAEQQLIFSPSPHFPSEQQLKVSPPFMQAFASLSLQHEAACFPEQQFFEPSRMQDLASLCSPDIFSQQHGIAFLSTFSDFWSVAGGWLVFADWAQATMVRARSIAITLYFIIASP